MKCDLHSHCTFCDGKDEPEAMAEAAVAAGFDRFGFSSHAMLPWSLDFTLSLQSLPSYVSRIREVAKSFRGKVEVLCGVEADYIDGKSSPDRTTYSAFGLDYVIGSVHFVSAADGALVPVDHSPELLARGIAEHFGGSAESFVRAYFAAEREMVARFDFDIVGHPDLVRKFNVRHPYFDEGAGWYREEVELTAETLARSGKVVEVNVGAISRGWLDDAYPSAEFRAALSSRGVRLVYSSDAHSVSGVGCAYDRFGATLASNPEYGIISHMECDET